MTEPRIVNLGVRVEDGLVFRRNRVIWVSCPACGPQPPRTAHHEALGCPAPLTHAKSITFDEGPFSCSVCGQDAPIRYAVIPKDGAKPRTKCNRRCLDGKLICNCHCRGRCHGEGTCTCKEDTDAATT